MTTPPIQNQTPKTKIETDDHIARIELLISTLLRIGVTLSLSVVILGTIMTFSRHPELRRDPQTLSQITSSNASFPHSLSDMFTGLANFRGQSIVILGLVLLIATPILRVAISIFIFLHDHDKPFVYITSLVLLLLLISFLVGKAGG